MADEKQYTSPDDKNAGATGETPGGARTTPAAGPNETADEAKRDVEDSINELRAELAALDAEQAPMARLQAWVEDNPTLATFLAAGVGILFGRLLRTAKKPFEPDPLPVRVRKQSKALAEEAQHEARDAANRVAREAKEAQRRAQAAGIAASGQARRFGDEASRRAKVWQKEGSKRARELSGEASKQARELGSEASERARTASARVSEQARRAGESARARAQEARRTVDERAEAFSRTDLGKRTAEARERAKKSSADLKKSSADLKKDVQKKARHGRNVYHIVRNVVGTAVGAAVVAKLTDWLRRVT